jgi:hypothetical protein
MQAAALCAQSIFGELTYKPTMPQQANNFGVPLYYVQLMLRLTPKKRARIASGEDKTSYLVLTRTLREAQKTLEELCKSGESFRSAWEKSHPNSKV